MGFFKKAKDAAASVHVQGAGLIDPAILGGPSTRSVAADDPIWAPINGVSLQDYADLARTAQSRGVTDEAGMIALGQERGGIRPTPRPRSTAGSSGWVSRWPWASSSASSSATELSGKAPLPGCRRRCIELGA